MDEELLPEEGIAHNAALVIDQMARIGVTLAYDAPSVAWLDGYINRLRASRLAEGDDSDIERFADILGCFLGECIRQTYGGEWARLERGWGLRLGSDGRLTAYPLHRVSRQFATGPTESVLSFFAAIPAVLARA